MKHGLLADKVVLVTGAARGIGRAIALCASAEGASLFLTDRDERGVRETLAAIEGAGGRAHALAGDLTAPEFPERLSLEVAEKFHRLDVLVNNAGVEHRGSVAEHTPEAWSRVIAINLTAPFLITRAMLGLLEKSNAGAIVNIASTAVAGFPGQVAYDSSKGGILSMTRSLAMDLARHRIRANAVCPGFIATDMVLQDSELKRLGELTTRALPIRRMGASEEIAEAVIWLASDRASYVTGQALFVDGGWIRT